MYNRRKYLSIFFLLVFATSFSQLHLPMQNKAVVENFYLDENDTLRYSHHYLYEQAYHVIEDMLIGNCSVDFAKAVFAVENCYFDGALDYTIFLSEIDRIVSGISVMASSPDITASSRDLALNYAIFLFYTQPCSLNNHRPYQYDLESIFADGGYSGGMVYNLLTTGHGTCRSLPYLYKILADRVGAHAFLANAPLHTYIRHQDATGQWWNFETTTGTYSRSSFIMDNFYITEEGIRSGLYMTNLTEKESVVQLLYDLLCYYEQKTGFYSNTFVRKCYSLGLQYHYADNLHIWEINDLKYQLDKEAWHHGLRSEDAIRSDSVFGKKYDSIQKLTEEFQRLGYHQYTKEEYIQKYKEVLDYMEHHNL